MKEKQFQINAVNAIQDALDRGQRHIVVEMVSGCGKSFVLAKTIEIIYRTTQNKILVVTRTINQREQLKDTLFNTYKSYIGINKDYITIETEHKVLRTSSENFAPYRFVAFFDTTVSEKAYETLGCKEKTVFVFSTIGQEKTHRLFQPKDVVFSYTYEQAVNDGYITPAMNRNALGPATEAFAQNLLERFGYNKCIDLPQSSEWDLLVGNGERKIYVECKTYKSQVVSPSAASSLLNTLVWRKMKYDIQNNDIFLLVVFSQIPSFQKDEIYERYHIIVWDIDNLVFYSKGNPSLLKNLAQITYFPMDYIEGQESIEASLAGLSLRDEKYELVHEVENEDSVTQELIQRLHSCKTGKKYSGEYEEICEKIIRVLFEANYFNRLTSQHKQKMSTFGWI